MAKKSDTLQVNFLKSSSFDASKTGKIITWVLTIGKSIVFITFAVVVFTFLYRFILDQKIEVLTDKIQNNIDEITQYNQEEQNLRDFQNRLNFVNKMNQSEKNVNKILYALEVRLPRDSQLTDISLGKDSLKFEGTAKNEIVFATFLSSLQQEEVFKEIIIDSLKSGGVQNPEIEFSVSLKIDEEAL